MSHLRRLSLRTFRNYTRADVEFGNGLTVLVGRNGQGKSNLLEAIYLVATGRSHRTTHEAETIQYGHTSARIRAHIVRRGRDEELEVALAAESDRLTSRIRVNGVVTPRGSLLGRLPVVLAAPWDLELVRGSGGGRRRLLDGALAQLSPSYFFALHRYHRVVTQRNAELRRKATTGLEPWDAQLTALGVRITAQRAAYVAQLQVHAEGWFARLGGEGHLRVGYRPVWQGASEEHLAIDAQAQLARVRADEYRRGMTLTGPHRDDVEFALDGISLRAGGSQGQWRTALLAVRLAERAVMAAEMGATPVLLLDDALVELDPQRQTRVLEANDGAQTMITVTAKPRTTRSVRYLAVDTGAVSEDASEEQWSHPSETS
jgi:DNA replication and repair protein RecF